MAFELCISRPSTDAALKQELDLLAVGFSSLFSSNSSWLGRILTLLYFLILYGGFAYGAYQLYQNKLAPYFDRSGRRRRPEDIICDKIEALNEQVVELSRNLVTVHEFVRTYCQSRDESVVQLRSELASIKSLLVSKNQFPSVPSIPRWQLVNGDGDRIHQSSDSSGEKSE